MSEHVNDANRHVDDNLECGVCGMHPVKVYWTDLPGEAMCKQCGTPYIIIMRTAYGMKIDSVPVINLIPAWIKIARDYWATKREFMGLGTIINERQYPECITGRTKFYEWARNNYGSLPR